MQTACVVPQSVAVRERTDAAWAALDEPAEWEGFSRPVAGREGWLESTLAIQGMHCASCALTVERALARRRDWRGPPSAASHCEGRLRWIEPVMARFRPATCWPARSARRSSACC